MISVSLSRGGGYRREQEKGGEAKELGRMIGRLTSASDNGGGGGGGGIRSLLALGLDRLTFLLLIVRPG